MAVWGVSFDYHISASVCFHHRHLSVVVSLIIIDINELIKFLCFQCYTYYYRQFFLLIFFSLVTLIPVADLFHFPPTLLQNKINNLKIHFFSSYLLCRPRWSTFPTWNHPRGRNPLVCGHRRFWSSTPKDHEVSIVDLILC